MAISVFGYSRVLGQEAETDITGLHVTGRLPFRKPNEPSCTVNFTFRGSKISGNPDTVISNITLVHALDNMGRDLLWTNPSSGETRTGGGCKINGEWELMGSVDLKSPSAEAKSLQIEGVADLLTPTIPKLVITNVVAFSGENLKDPLLDKYNIQIKVINHQNGSSQTIAFECKDPNHQLIAMEFQHQDGTPIDDSAISLGEMQIGPNPIRSYTFKKEYLQNISLVLRLDVPLRRETTHFRIVWLRLPWIQPPSLEVTSIETYTDKKAKWGYCFARVTFQGGMLTNAQGIRKVVITKALDSASEDITTVMEHLAPYDFDMREALDSGGTVTKGIWFQPRLSPLKMIRSLEGDVELFYGSTTNLVMVDLRSDLKPSEKMTSPKLNGNEVSFTFVGARNFNKTEKELDNSDDFVLHSWFRKEIETPEDLKDSLLFSYEDPKNVMMSHTQLFWEFLDGEEYRISPNTLDYTPKSWLLRFDKLPKKARVVVYTVDPSSIRRVHFRAENILVR